jgi:GTP-binding protein
VAEADLDPALLERGRLLFAQPCEFLLSVVRVEDLPPPVGVEVAFAGRSNVGKSSLLNALTGRSNLARTSVTPGRTQALNFFRLADRLTLVDLPGYGFAKADKASIGAWTRLHNAYLRGRPNLRRVLILIDARHGLKPKDEATMTALDEAAVSYQTVLTKVDKVSAAALDREMAETARRLRTHVAAHPQIIATSAHEGTGMPALRAALAALCESPA